MSVSQHTDSIIIEYDCQFRVEMPDSSITNIHKAFSELQPQILTDFTQKMRALKYGIPK